MSCVEVVYHLTYIFVLISIHQELINQLCKTRRGLRAGHALRRALYSEALSCNADAPI